MRYILGIDFGHGETAAAFAEQPQNDKQLRSMKPEEAQIKRTNRNDRELESAIRQDKRGNWGVNLGASKLVISFKGTVDALTQEQSDAFQAYIKEVYGRIKKHHPERFERDDSNFDLYIASPTKWTEPEKTAYKRFVEEALGRSVGWVINESDAAYFHKRSPEQSDGTVLVIDFGSSTIDYTLMIDNKKVDIDSLSNSLGARNIEQILFESYRVTDNYRDNIEKARAELIRTGNEHIDLEAEIMFAIRKAKEITYSENNPIIKGMWILAELITDRDSEIEITFQFRFSNFETLIAEYQSLVIHDFERLKAEIDDRLGNRGLDRIILSGGASIMPWVQDGVQRVFGTEIVEDDDRSYVVAKGIVKYAAAQELGKRKIESILNQQDYLSLYQECDQKATRESIQKMMPSILSEYHKSSKDLSGNDLLARLTVFFENMRNSPEFVREFEKIFNKQLSLKIEAILKETMRSTFDYNLEDTISMSLSNIPIFEFPSSIIELTKKWVKTAAKTFWPFNWNKPRNSALRKKIADGCLNSASKIRVVYDDNATIIIVDQIKQKAIDCALKVFYEKQLFRTV